MKLDKYAKRARRKRSIRKKVYGTEERPRLTVFRSNKHLYAQIINDDKSETLCAVTTNAKSFNKADGFTVKTAGVLGKELAEKAKEKKIDQIVFDRNGYRFHGKIKAFTDSFNEVLHPSGKSEKQEEKKK